VADRTVRGTRHGRRHRRPARPRCPTSTVALALAAAPFGGLLSADELGDAHYLLCGRAAAHGCWAARAARAGLTASTTLLDAPAETAIGRPAADPSPAGSPHLATTALKAWPCARPLHTALAALTELGATGVTPQPGDTVELALPGAALRFVTAQRHPVSPVEAATSAAVTVGGAITGRAIDPGWYRDVAEGRAALPDVSVRLRPDVGLDALFPARWATEVTIRRGAYTFCRRVLVAPGDPDRPLSDDALLAKAAGLLHVPNTAPVLHALLGLGGEPAVAPLRVAITNGRYDAPRNTRPRHHRR
jgi:2-methylcitrate dehydratase PrpD